MSDADAADSIAHLSDEIALERDQMLDALRSDGGAPRQDYDPFAAGPHDVEVRTLQFHDQARDRTFPVECWAPRAVVEPHLIAYSHHSGGQRHVATFLCSHLASHGYTVVAMDHSEVVAKDLPENRIDRIASIVGGRVPDLRFLLDRLGADDVGLAGHSFGGWAVLATAEADARVASVVAMAPAGATHPRPGVLDVNLTMARRREVPVLFLAASEDVPIPLANVRDVYDRTPAPKRLLVLPRADHQHFLDDVEGAHEAVRHAQLAGDAAWIPRAMRPIGELMPGDEAQRWVRGATLAHFDATLRGRVAARGVLEAMGRS